MIEKGRLVQPKRFSELSAGRKAVLCLIPAAVVAAAAVIVFLLFQGPGQTTDNYFVPATYLLDYLENSQDGGFRIVHNSFGLPAQKRADGNVYSIKSVVQKVPGTFTWPAAIPDGSVRLEFTVGLRLNGADIPRDLLVRVFCNSGEKKKVLYEKRFPAEKGDRKYAYYLEKIPLNEFAGSDSTITFESDYEGGAQDGALEVAWGNPALYVEEDHGTPNIILICLDTLRTDRTSGFTLDSGLTPVIGQLAEDGVVFRHAVTQSPWTLPTVASILTGVYPSFHRAGKRIVLEAEKTQQELSEEERGQGIVLDRSRHILSKLPAEVKTLPEMMAGRYACHMVNGNLVLKPGADIVTRFPSFDDGNWRGHVISQKAKIWLRDNADKRFFLYTHFMEPHEWWWHYKQQYPDREEYDPVESRDFYDNFVARGDMFIGRFLDYLRDLDLYDSALIIFYSDHGEHLRDEGWENEVGHGNTLSDILLEVPLIVKFPNSKYAGTEVEQYVKLMDLFSTILVEAGLEVPDDPLSAAGVSLRDVVEGKVGNLERDTISEYMLYGRESIAL
jgi:hypothetical protein